MATSEQISSFIKLLGKLAVAECNRRISQGKGFVLPSVCIAQSAIETGWGTAGIMVKANAFFGIKAGGSWTGAVYRADTWEVADGSAYNTTANFRAYGSLAESVADYYDLIGNSTRYVNALSYGLSNRSWKTPKECITAIWSGGYATDTLYVEKIMSTINSRNLANYDKLIDGVTFEEGNFASVFGTYSKGDFVNGALAVLDSGRTLGTMVGTGFENYLSLDLSKMFESPSEMTLRINHNLPNVQGIIIGRLIGDTATLQTGVNNLDTITVTAGEKIAVGFHMKEPITVDQLPDNLIVTLNNPIYNGEETYSSEFAYFVKIE